MSVDYSILIVNEEIYREWTISLEDLSAEERLAAQAGREEFVTEVNDRLYPGDQHMRVGQLANQILKALDQGEEAEVERPVGSFLGRVMGKKEMVVERQAITDPSLMTFRSFARVIYWSQAGGLMSNQFAAMNSYIEISLSSSGLLKLEADLEAFDPAALTAFCKDKGVDLSELETILPGGLAALKAGWLGITQECVQNELALVIEVNAGDS